MKKHSLALPVALLLSLAGCDGGVALEEAPAETAQVFCSRNSECLGSFSGLLPGGGDCESTFAARLQNGAFATLGAAVDRGTTSYDGAAASRCLAASEMLGCDIQNAPQPAACAEVFVGTIAAGAPCSISEECTGDAYCNGASCPETAGTCTARVAAGGSCTSGAACSAGLSCNDGTCGTPPSTLGQACEGLGGCALDQVCSEGTCVLRSGVETASQGESCNLFGGAIVLCRDGVSCALTGVGVTGATFECAPDVGSGAACNFAVPSVCPSGEYCAGVDVGMGMIEGTCTAKPAAEEACGRSTLGEVCADGLICEGGEVCRAQLPNGSSCSSAAACYSGRCEEGICAAPPLCDP